jgi:predicted GNAT family N-acyltransferase
MITLKIATNDAELNEIYSFRYKIYVNEMNKKEEHADHINKRIIDPIDSHACNIAAWDNGRMVGCVRLNMGFESDLGHYRKLYKMDEIKGFVLNNSSVCSRFMIDKYYRNSRLNVLMQQFCFKIGLQNDMYYCFIESKDSLIHYYQKFGFKTYTSRIPHAEYGDITPMVLEVQNIDYLEELRSPLLAIYSGLNLENRLHSVIAA